jgi:cell division protein FtsQ
VAAVATEAGYTTVDAAGVALATSEAQPEGLPLAEVDAGLNSDAFAAVGQVLRALPDDLRSRVSRIQASSREDVTFELTDGGGVSVIWGSPGHRGEGPCSHRGLHGDPARHGVELRRVVVGRAGRDGVTTRDFF